MRSELGGRRGRERAEGASQALQQALQLRLVPGERHVRVRGGEDGPTGREALQRLQCAGERLLGDGLGLLQAPHAQLLLALAQQQLDKGAERLRVGAALEQGAQDEARALEQRQHHALSDEGERGRGRARQGFLQAQAQHGRGRVDQMRPQQLGQVQRLLELLSRRGRGQGVAGRVQEAVPEVDVAQLVLVHGELEDGLGRGLHTHQAGGELDDGTGG